MSTQTDWPTLAKSAPELLATATVRMMLGHMGVSGTKTRPLALAFVRVTARALLDYERAREASVQDGSLPDLYRSVQAIGDLENCIVSLHRSLCYLEALRSLGLVTWHGDQMPLKPMNMPVFATGARKRLTALRDAITHMDERIAKGEFPAGVPIAPQVKDGIVSLEDVEICIDELVRWLDLVAGVAMRIAEQGARGLAE
jgi:hypothetical protein